MGKLKTIFSTVVAVILVTVVALFTPVIGTDSDTCSDADAVSDDVYLSKNVTGVQVDRVHYVLDGRTNTLYVTGYSGEWEIFSDTRFIDYYKR